MAMIEKRLSSEQCEDDNRDESWLWSEIKPLAALKKEAPFIAAQWRNKVRQTNVTGKFDGKRLLKMLLKLRKTNNPAIPGQVVRIDEDLQALEIEIETAEADMNALTYRLYKLTTEEIRLVEQG